MICIGIVLASHALGMMRGYIGDVIIVMFFYTLVQSFILGSRRRVALSTVLFAFCTELCQYANILKWFGLSDSPLAVLVFGSVYDPFDLLAYAIG